MARATFKGSPVEKLLNSKLWTKQVITCDTTAKEAFDLDDNDIFLNFIWSKFKNSYTAWRREKIRDLDGEKNPDDPPLATFTVALLVVEHHPIASL
jgi:hypothetical protein